MLIKNINKGGLDYKSIKEKCPKSSQKLEEFMNESLKAFQQSMLEDFGSYPYEEKDFEIPEITTEIVEESIQNMLSSGALRSLYEFFDNNGVYVAIIPPHKAEDWKWNIHKEGNPGVLSNEATYNNRSRAEVFGFSKAFEELESKL